jgi:TonB family protein
VRYPENELSGLPMVINTTRRRSGVPWLSTALVFVTFSAITFALLAVKGTQLGNGKLAQIMGVIFPSGDLGLHVETQGDRLLLSWNRRNPAVASAADGVLQIFDGTQHREVRLDGSQVADGSVLYKPLSPDVTFRLEVHGTGQSSAMGSMRVLDATAVGRETKILDLTASPSTSARVPAGGPPDPLPAPETAQPAAPRAGQPESDKTAPTKNAEPGQLVNYRNPNSAPVVPVSVRPAPASSGQTSNQNAARQPAGAGALPIQQPPVDAKANTSKSERVPDASPQQNAAAQPPPHPVSLQPPAAGSTINGWDTSVPQTQRPAPQPDTTTPAPAPALDARPPAFDPPKPLSQVMPNTRSLAPGLITQVTRVEVAVRIDNTGRVMSAHVLNESGNTKGALSEAAVNAARQWTFQPATLQGEKVESEHTIVFEFRPDK